MSDRLMVGLIVLAIIIVVGGLLARQYFEGAPTVTVKQVEEATKPSRKTSVRATMTACSKVGEKVQVDGIVHNIGTTILSAVTVQSIWKDADGGILDTGIIYAVGDVEPLAPGEKRKFSDTTKLRNVAKCNVKALDWWSSDT